MSGRDSEVKGPQTSYTPVTKCGNSCLWGDVASEETRSWTTPRDNDCFQSEDLWERTETLTVGGMGRVESGSRDRDGYHRRGSGSPTLTCRRTRRHCPVVSLCPEDGSLQGRSHRGYVSVDLDHAHGTRALPGRRSTLSSSLLPLPTSPPSTGGTVEDGWTRIILTRFTLVQRRSISGSLNCSFRGKDRSEPFRLRGRSPGRGVPVVDRPRSGSGRKPVLRAQEGAGGSDVQSVATGPDDGRPWWGGPGRKGTKHLDLRRTENSCLIFISCGWATPYVDLISRFCLVFFNLI